MNRPLSSGPQLRLHGGGAAVRLGERVAALEHKDALLLAYLSLEGPTPRSRLAALLWPEADAERARAALRQRLARLKKQLGAELVGPGETASLADGVMLEAVAGDLLPLVDADDKSELGAWLARQRLRELQTQRNALEAAGAEAEAGGDLTLALAHALAVVDLDPTSEHAHRRVIALHHLRGDRAAALAAYERCRELLERELGVTPSRETEALRHQVEHGATVARPHVQRGVPATVLRPPRLVGRDAEWQALEDAWSGRAALLVIGEAGMGKTRLLTDLAMARGDAVVVTARPGDARVPYALLSRLVRALLARSGEGLPSGVRDELARLLPELGEAEPLRHDGDRARFMNALEALLSRASTATAGAAPATAGVIVDDLHFADAASVEALQHLAGAEPPLAWLVAWRPGELASEAQALVQELARSRRATELRLRPLSEAQVAELIDSLGVPELAGPALAARVARHSGGNPLFVLETLKALWLQGEAAATGNTLPVARGVAALVTQRIAQLSAAAVRLARCAAVAGQDFSAELAAFVLDSNALDLADAWNELEQAQVFRGGAFVHDLVHDAALASVSAPIATHLHARIASFLEERGADPGRVAAHWLDARDHERALAALQVAAEAAGRTLRTKEQTALLVQAAEVAEALGRSDEAFATIAAAIERLLGVDRTLVDEALLDRAERLAARDAQRALVLRLRAELAIHFGEYEAASPLLERAVRLAQRAGDEALAVQAQQLQAVNASVRGEFDRAAALMQPLVAWFAEHGSPDQQVEFYGHLALVLDNANRTEEALPIHRRTLALAAARSRENLPVFLGNLALNRLVAGDMQAALDALQDSERERLLHDELKGVSGATSMMLSAVLRELGRYGEALSWAEMALGALQQQSPMHLRVLHAHLACLWLHLGQPARAQRELDAAARLGEGPAWMQARCAQMALRLAFALGRGAAGAAAHALDLAPEGGRILLREMILLDHALTLTPAEALTVAERIARESLARGHRGTALAAQVRACRFALAAGRVDRAADHARQALAEQAETAPNDLYPAELWLNAWRAFAAAGDTDPARLAVDDGVRWVQATAAQQVPAEFRESFLQRNPVNRELLTAATRLPTVDATPRSSR